MPGIDIASPVSPYLTGFKSEILKTILYFDVFRYPLTRGEIFENAAHNGEPAEIAAELEELLALGLLHETNGFIHSTLTDPSCVERRIKANKMAQAILPTAKRYVRKVAAYPFVRGICLSGGLSKNYYDDKSDVDYFIITKPGALWICRTLLTIRYKLLPKNKKKFWCINYFISSDALEIPDKNLFTATELSFVLPTYNYSLYKELMAKNEWRRENYPNKTILPDSHCVSIPREGLKRCIEFLFTGWGGLFDTLLLRVTLLHWQRKFPDMEREDFELQFRSRKTACKRHNTGYQNKVLVQWQEKQATYAALHKITFH